MSYTLFFFLPSGVLYFLPYNLDNQEECIRFGRKIGCDYGYYEF